MSEKEQEIWDAISSKLNGDQSAEEQRVIEQWLAEDDKNRKAYEYLNKLGYDKSLEHALANKDRIFDKVQNRISETKTRKMIQLWQYVAAASVTLLIAVSTFLFVKSNKTDDVAHIVTQCPFGVRSLIQLPDGTIVKLNSGSTLSYPAAFKGDHRDVILKGEAYFEVAKDKKRPFIVSAGGVLIKVLGTHFNVKAYADDNEVKAALIEGSISIEPAENLNKTESIILKPNQQATFVRNTKKIIVQDVKAELFVVWTAGKYYFEGENFLSIAKKLERGFNVKIIIESDELKQEVFSGIFDKDESIKEILDIMKRHRNFDYKQNENEIRIFANNN